MVKVLISIKPEFVQKILSGEKRFEYRKNIFIRDDVRKILIYATKPVGKIVGEFDCKQIISGKVMEVWQKTKNYSGIKPEFYQEYFAGKEKAFAIKIDNLKIYKKAINPFEKYKNFTAPQSYKYID